MNPLETGKIFSLTLRHPKPRFSDTKDGCKYYMLVEITQEDWQNLVDARNKKGMVIECSHCEVVNSNAEEQDESWK